MPKRTNDFQRLILMIEKSLAGEDATVEESGMVRDRTTGELREVDILITRRVGQREVRISIECRDHGRRQGPDWIEQLVAKRADLKLDRVVAVSRSGFSRPAREKSEFHGIEALTLNQAIARDWVSAFDDLSHMTVTEFRGDVHHIRVIAPEADQTIQLDMTGGMSSVQVVDQRTGAPGTLQDMANQVVNLESVHERVTEAAAFGTPHPMMVTLNFPEGAVLTDVVGTTIQIRALEFHVMVTRLTTEVPFRLGDYGDSRVSYAVSEVEGRRHAIVLVQERNQDTQVGYVTLPPSNARTSGRD